MKIRICGFVSLLLALSACLQTVCQAREAGLKELEKTMKKAAKGVAGSVTGKTCVVDFSKSGGLSDTSEFGQVAANLLTSYLSKFGPKEMRLTGRPELLKIMRDSAIFGDPETVQKLVKEAGMDTMVAGDYSAAGSRISLTVKTLQASSGRITASSTFFLNKTPDLEKMLAHEFRQLGAPPEETAAAQGKGGLIEVETGVYYEGGDGKLYPVREGMVLTSDDNYAVYLKPKQPCYVYVYQIDSANKAFKIFPNPEYVGAANPLPAGGEHWLPEKGFLFLDKNPGKEELYIFASQRPLPGLESLKDASFASVEESMRLMGVGGRRGEEVAARVTDTSGSPANLITRKLIADGGFYYRLSFIHR